VAQTPLSGGLFYAILVTSQIKVMLFDIEVRPGPDSDFFQYYTETVEANTHSDAVARVERRNPGCTCRCTNSYNASKSSSSSTDSGDMLGYLGLFAILFVIWLFIEFWYIAIPVTIAGAILWWKNRD
tara:strand:+ start:278 stop:658 length:381 start_codon:yes stop_codon:yes gene_type:complete